jgi:hypothetical protein
VAFQEKVLPLFVVPTTVGRLVRDNILVSNFNNSKNLQGTGTTIMQVTPNKKVSVFAHINAKRPCVKAREANWNSYLDLAYQAFPSRSLFRDAQTEEQVAPEADRTEQ